MAGHDFYLGGRHEMLNEINRREVLELEACLNGWLRSGPRFRPQHELRAGVKSGSLLGHHEQSKKTAGNKRWRRQAAHALSNSTC